MGKIKKGRGEEEKMRKDKKGKGEEQGRRGVRKKEEGSGKGQEEESPKTRERIVLRSTFLDFYIRLSRVLYKVEKPSRKQRRPTGNVALRYIVFDCAFK